MGSSRRVRVFQVDAFTTQLFAGNPATVVLNAETLSDEEMQAMAREFRGQDSAFVLAADAADHDVRVRFFTPHGEAGFIGHATIALHAVRDSLGLPACKRQRQRSGIVDIETIAESQATRFAFSQPPPPLQQALEASALGAISEALGLMPTELDASCPAIVAGAGGARALLAVRDGHVLARLRPDLTRLAALSASGSPPGFFVFTLAPAIPDCETEARMFCPAIGINEDPVSGNAHAMLATHLCALQRMPERSGRWEFTGRQGHHLGRPGVLQVSVEHRDGAPRSVRIAGGARIVWETLIKLD